MKTKIAEIVCQILKEKQWGIFFKNEPMQSLQWSERWRADRCYQTSNGRKDEWMAKSSGRRRAKSDRQRIIDWYKSDLIGYRLKIGELTKYNVLVTEELIQRTEDRVAELEERERKWEQTLDDMPPWD